MVDITKAKEAAIGLWRRYGPALRTPGGMAVVLAVVVFLAIWIFSGTGRIWLFGGTPPRGVDFTEVRADGIADLKSLYEQHGKTLDAVLSGTERAPRLAVVKLPDDINGDVPVDERKQAFLATVLPAVLIANREITVRRLRLLRLLETSGQGRTVAKQDREWLVRMAERYGTDPETPQALRNRIDIIPVSLAVAQAAVESGWGTARFAREGTALYGIHGDNGDGAVEAEGADGLFLRGYDSILASVRDYAHLLNSHRAYAGFRKLRAERRAAGAEMSGTVLAGTLIAYSERNEHYVQTLRQVIRDNDLARLDAARLEEETP